MKRSADLINDILRGIDNLIQNIRKLYSNIKRSLKTKRNVTI